MWSFFTNDCCSSFSMIANTYEMNYWNYPFHAYSDPAESCEDSFIDNVRSELRDLLSVDFTHGLDNDSNKRLVCLLQSTREMENLHIAFLMSLLGCKLNGLEHHSQAEHLHRRALCIGVKCLGQDHPDLASAMEWLAFSLYKQGIFKEAVLLCYSTIVLVHEAVGPFHLKTATCYYNLAMIVEAMGLLDHAQVLRAKGFSLLAVLYPHFHHYWWTMPPVEKEFNSYQLQRKHEGWSYPQDPVFYPPLTIPYQDIQPSTQIQQPALTQLPVALAGWMPPTAVPEENNYFYSNGTIATY